MKTVVGIQYLRGIAAMAVLFYHISFRYHFDFEVGRAGVDVFFIISGFVMWVSTYGRSNTFGKFMFSRIRRVVPLYWAVTFLTIAVIALKPQFFREIAIGANEILKSLFFIPYFRENNETLPIVLQGWTLNVEMLFYLIFGLTVSRGEKVRLYVPTAILVGLVAWGYLYRVDDSAPMMIWRSSLLLELAAGLWVGFLYTSGRLNNCRYGWALVAASVSVFIAAHVLQWDSMRWRVVFFGIPAMMLVIGMVMQETYKGMPHSSVLAYMGEASYSIYLWHTLAISVFAFLGLRFGLGEDAVSAVIVCTLTIAASFAGYILIEKPLTRVLRPNHVRIT